MNDSLSRLDRQFWEFHNANPEVYTQLVDLARQAKKAGKQKVGIKMIYEVVRWTRFLQTIDEASDFKLNNNYHSRYARLIMATQPDLVGIFDLRELRS